MQTDVQNIKRGIAFLAQIAFALVFALGVIFGLHSHSESVFLYSGFGGAVCVLIALVVVALEAILNRQFPRFSTLWLASIGSAFFGTMVVMFYYGLTIAIRDAYYFATSPDFSDATSILLVGFGTLIAGAVLFYFRLKWRCLYGFSETLVGVAVASQKFYVDALAAPGHTPTTFVVLAILTAGVYLVVRGLDNIHQGLTKPPLDPFGQKIVRLLNTIGKKDAEIGLSIAMSLRTKSNSNDHANMQVASAFSTEKDE